REAAERALRESEARYRGTFDNAGVGIVHATLDGRYLQVNQRYCDFLGYDREALSKKTFRDVTHPDDLGSNDALLGALARGEIPSIATEKRYIHRSGAVLWAYVAVSVQRDAAGKPLHIIGIVQDITEQKRLDAELRSAKAAAETANQAKDEFLANVS